MTDKLIPLLEASSDDIAHASGFAMRGEVLCVRVESRLPVCVDPVPEISVDALVDLLHMNLAQPMPAGFDAVVATLKPANRRRRK